MPPPRARPAPLFPVTQPHPSPQPLVQLQHRSVGMADGTELLCLLLTSVPTRRTSRSAAPDGLATVPGTQISSPRRLATPQLLLSNVWAIVPLVMRGPTTVFTHRGLPPHQFTPMSGAHHALQRTAGRRSLRTLVAIERP